MKKIISFSAVVGMFPMAAFAASQSLFNVLAIVNVILGTVIPILITLAVVYFIWGVIQYTVSNDEEAKKGARGKIIQGLIGLFIILAFWGIVFMIQNTLGISNVQLQKNDIPCVPTPVNPC